MVNAINMPKALTRLSRISILYFGLDFKFIYGATSKKNPQYSTWLIHPVKAKWEWACKRFFCSKKGKSKAIL